MPVEARRQLVEVSFPFNMWALAFELRSPDLAAITLPHRVILLAPGSSFESCCKVGLTLKAGSFDQGLM